MKSLKLVGLLALLFAANAAFTAKFDKTIYRISDGFGNFHWALSPEGKECTYVTELSCSEQVPDNLPLPADNTEPSSGTPSAANGMYQ